MTLEKPVASIASIVLAAGLSSRMKSKNKLTERLNGTPVLLHALNAVGNSDISETVIVLGHESKKIQSLLKGYRSRIVDNPLYQSGISSSIKAGIESISKSVDGAVITLGDMPGITPDILNALIRNFEPGKICIPVYNGKPGNPVLWSKRFFRNCAVLREIPGAGVYFTNSPGPLYTAQ